MIPHVLRSIADRIGSDDRVDVTGNWEKDERGRWHLPVRARLATEPADHMPAESLWRLVIGSKQPDDGVHFYPDADGGLEVTFRHQDRNAAPAPGTLWRTGKPCLERPIAGLGRDDWADEPREIEAAAMWKTGRLLQWIDAAAADDLVAIGAPNELPAGLGQGSTMTVGFSENIGDMERLNSVDTRWGFASVPAVPGAKSTWALTELFDERAASIRRFEWGSAIGEIPPSINAVWLVARALPVREPWDGPTTWADLTELLARQGVDLTSILASAGARHRASSRPVTPHRLLIGFPYSSRFGHAPERLHWLALGKIPLAGRTEKRAGFRPREETRRMWDRELSRSHKALSWMRTENWAPDQLRSRGGAEQQVRDKKLLVIGAGSLGSAVAENLCRAGALNLGILDGETLTVGNLVRHALTMVDVGLNKADALAKTLNFVSPHAAIKSMPHRFQANMADDAAEAVRGYDVVIDCTGSDDLLHELAAFEWRDEKLFVSLSMTWGADGLLAFSASETIFPVIDAKHRFAEAGAPLVRHADANVEAIGCWNPVFPADADDVQQWAAFGTRFVRETILNPSRRLKYFRRTGDGGTEVIDV